ncbi:late competence protein ComER [Paenibacillus thermoaerophilus]|uniref:Pyrroline-5-carboxylate reductase n=1 Tax=Paenibacillus thermoaerophilus TaxID=1215385 RepID=A0ABW2V1A6_9BACL|nr:late competence protein ComER [Paenibacillus thermoaerophilus]TMV18973.1 late competence protein ComER [Paenibacillus thermoaerophilus]
MKAGFIGTGSMGSLLIEAFIRSGALSPEQILVTNRTPAKARLLAERFPGVAVASSNSQAAAESSILFLCVKPMEFKRVIDEIRSAVAPSQIIVSITSPVQIRHLEEELPAKIAKVVPSIANRALAGATLCAYGKRMREEDISALESLLSRISTPIRIDERHTRVASDISSCGPAFLAFFLQQLVDAAVRVSGIPRETALRMAVQMAGATGSLLASGQFTPEELQARVAVPGGITAEGLKLLDRDLNGVFDELLRVTHAKYEEDLDKLDTLFFGTIKD